MFYCTLSSGSRAAELDDQYVSTYFFLAVSQWWFLVVFRIWCNTGSNRVGICLQTLFLLFKCPKRETKESFVSPANGSLVGILITIGDVIDIFAIASKPAKIL